MAREWKWKWKRNSIGIVRESNALTRIGAARPAHGSQCSRSGLASPVPLVGACAQRSVVGVSALHVIEGDDKQPEWSECERVIVFVSILAVEARLLNVLIEADGFRSVSSSIAWNEGVVNNFTLWSPRACH